MDNRIIESVHSQDEQGIQMIEKSYGQMIRYILFCLRLSEQDIDECYNDVLIALWNHLENYDKNQSSFKNYIALITRRIGLNYVRKNQKLYQEIQYEHMDIFSFQQQDIKIDWDYVVEKLSYQEKDLFYRYFYYFQRIEDIALEKGKTYKSVESSIYRLRKKLKMILKEVSNNE